MKERGRARGRERGRVGGWEMTDDRRRYQSNLSLLTSCCCPAFVVVVGGVGGVRGGFHRLLFSSQVTSQSVQDTRRHFISG